LVVGFRGREVAEHAIQLRPEITIATNEYFSSTVAGSSVAIGATVAHHERLIVLNGDVLVHPDDWVRVLSHGNPFVGVSKAVSRDAIYVEEDPCDSSVVGFTRRRRHHEHEWTGICGSSRSDWLDGGQGHIYQQLEKSLPMDAVHLRTAEIDYPEDLLPADRFARRFLEPALSGC